MIDCYVYNRPGAGMTLIVKLDPYNRSAYYELVQMVAVSVFSPRELPVAYLFEGCADSALGLAYEARMREHGHTVRNITPSTC